MVYAQYFWGIYIEALIILVIYKVGGIIGSEPWNYEQNDSNTSTISF